MDLPQRRLDYMTWADARDYLASGGDTAILPVGSTEMHGPHLPYTWTGATRHFAGVWFTLGRVSPR